MDDPPQHVLMLPIRREMALYAKTRRPIHAWRAYRWISASGAAGATMVSGISRRMRRGLVRRWIRSHRKMSPKRSLWIARGRNASTASDQLAAAEHVAALKYKLPDASIEELFAEVAECS